MRIISGMWRGRPISAPPGHVTRPTSDRNRGSLFSLLLSLPSRAGGPVLVPAFDDLCVLDLYAGSGALGMEALSRGARRAVFIDDDAESVRCIRRNLAALDVPPHRTTVHQGSLPNALDAISPAPFDLIFADPPYAIDPSALLGRLSSPSGPLVRKGSVLAIEVAAGARPRGGSGWQLRHVRRYGGTEFLFFVAQVAGSSAE